MLLNVPYISSKVHTVSKLKKKKEQIEAELLELGDGQLIAKP